MHAPGAFGKGHPAQSPAPLPEGGCSRRALKGRLCLGTFSPPAWGCRESQAGRPSPRQGEQVNPWWATTPKPTSTYLGVPGALLSSLGKEGESTRSLFHATTRPLAPPSVPHWEGRERRKNTPPHPPSKLFSRPHLWHKSILLTRLPFGSAPTPSRKSGAEAGSERRELLETGGGGRGVI